MIKLDFLKHCLAELHGRVKYPLSQCKCSINAEFNYHKTEKNTSPTKINSNTNQTPPKPPTPTRKIAAPNPALSARLYRIDAKVHIPSKTKPSTPVPIALSLPQSLLSHSPSNPTMSTILRTLRNLRQIGIKQYAHQMQYIGDTKAGTYIATDKYGNKYYENQDDELPRTSPPPTQIPPHHPLPFPSSPQHPSFFSQSAPLPPMPQPLANPPSPP